MEKPYVYITYYFRTMLIRTNLEKMRKVEGEISLLLGQDSKIVVERFLFNWCVSEKGKLIFLKHFVG